MPADNPFSGDERIGVRTQAGPRQQLSGQQQMTDSVGQDIPGERGEAPDGHLPVEGPGDFAQQGIKQPMEAFTPCMWGAQSYMGQVEPDAIVQSETGMALVSVARICSRCPMEPGCYGMSEEEAEERMIEKQKDMLQPPPEADPMMQEDPSMADQLGANGAGDQMGGEQQAEGAHQRGAPQEGGEEQMEEERPGAKEKKPDEKKPEAKKPGGKPGDKKPAKKKLDTSPEDEDGTVKKKLKEAHLTKEAAIQALAECGFLPSSISFYIDDLYR